MEFAITLFFLVLGAFGFLLGLGRGWKKALLRALTILVAALLTAPLTPMVSASLLDAPLIDGKNLSTVIEEAIASSAEVSQIMEASPTLAALVDQFPVTLCNLVLFVLVFILLTIVGWILDLILGAILFHKQKKTGRLIGALIGFAQGAFVSCVILLPIIGMFPTVDAAMDVLGAMPGDMADTVDQYSVDYYEPIKADPCYTILDSCGVCALMENQVQSITTFYNEKGDEFCLIRDFKENKEAFAQLFKLADVDFSAMTSEDVTTLRGAVHVLTETPLFSNILTEILPYAANTMRNGQTFAGLALPDGMDATTHAFLSDALDSIADAEPSALLNDLDNMVGSIGELSQKGVLSALGGNGEGDDLMSVFTDTDVAGSILSATVKSYILSPLVVSAINNFGMDMIAGALNVPHNDKESFDRMADTLSSALENCAKADYSDIATIVPEADINRVSKLLRNAAQGLTNDDADETARELIRHFCDSSVSATVSSLDVATFLNARPVTALQREHFNSLLVQAEDLKVKDIYVFRNMTDAKRQTEVDTLSQVLGDAFSLTDTLGEGGLDLSSSMDALPTVGRVMDRMGASVLLSSASRGLMTYFLSMDEIRSVLPDSAIDALNAKIQAGDICYEAIFSNVASAYKMASSIGSIGSTEDLTNALADLFTNLDADSVEILRETVNEDFLESLGVPAEVGGVASSVITNYFDMVAATDGEGLDFGKEAAAIESLIGFLNDSGAEDGGEGKADAITDEVIDTILESEVITDTLIAVVSDETIAGGLSEQFSSDDKEQIANLLDNYTGTEGEDEKTQACLDALRSLIGIERP